MVDVAYKPGELHIQTVFDENGRSIYGGKGADTYRALGYEIMSLDRASDLITEEQHKTYCKGWTRISEEAWYEALEVLPPEKWQTIGGVEMFRLMEYTTGAITAHYARIGEYYYCCNESIFTDYEKLVAQVKAYHSTIIQEENNADHYTQAE